MRPAAVMPPRLAEDVEDDEPLPALFEAVLEALFGPIDPPPLRAFAQRARAAAASLARVAADIGRRRPSCFAPVAAEEEAEPDVEVEEDDDCRCPPAPKSELSRSSSDWICSRSDTASLSLSKDRSIGLL